MLKTRQATWSVSCSRAPMWADDRRPYLFLVLDETAGLVIHLELLDEPPDAPATLKLLERAQRSPRVRGAQLGRLLVEEHLAEVSAYARRRGVQCALGRPSVLRAQVIAGLAEEYETRQYGRRRESMVEKLGPELTRAVFQAAARFAALQPWPKLTLETPEGHRFDISETGVELNNTVTLGFGPESAVSFPDLDFVERTEHWPVFIPALPTPKDTRLLLAGVLAACQLRDQLGEEWRSAELPEGLWPTELRFRRAGLSEEEVTAWMEGWPKASRKLARLLLEFQRQEGAGEQHLWRLGALWSERVPRFSVKKALEEGPCEKDYKKLYKPSAAEWKAFLKDYQRLEAHLTGHATLKTSAP